jgi:hypothetical protein
MPLHATLVTADEHREAATSVRELAVAACGADAGDQLLV